MPHICNRNFRSFERKDLKQFKINVSQARRPSISPETSSTSFNLASSAADSLALSISNSGHDFESVASQEWPCTEIDLDEYNDYSQMKSSSHGYHLKGWGSCESRQAYSCLATLSTRSNVTPASFSLSEENSCMDYEPTSISLRRNENYVPRQMNEWGFFVDSVDSC